MTKNETMDLKKALFIANTSDNNLVYVNGFSFDSNNFTFDFNNDRLEIYNKDKTILVSDILYVMIEYCRVSIMCADYKFNRIFSYGFGKEI